jgi:hypothetical protein
LRRFFSIIGVLAILFSQTALAWFPHGSGNVISNVVMMPNAATNNYMFINFLKSCTYSMYPDGTYNADDYPQANPTSGDQTCHFAFPPSSDWNGDVYVTWTGTFGATCAGGLGPDGLPGNCTGVVAGVKTDDNNAADTYSIIEGTQYVTNGNRNNISQTIYLTGTNGKVRIHFLNGGTHTQFQITFLSQAHAANTISNVTNVAIYRQDRDALYQAGAIFEPDYINMLKKMHPKVIRWMGNHSAENVLDRTNYTYMPGVNAISYMDFWYPPQAFAGSASGLSAGGNGFIYSGTGGSTSCGAGTVTGVNYCGAATYAHPSGAYVDGEVYQGYIQDQQVLGAGINASIDNGSGAAGQILTINSTSWGTIAVGQAVGSAGADPVQQGTVIDGTIDATHWHVNISQLVASRNLVSVNVPTLNVGGRGAAPIEWGDQPFGGARFDVTGAQATFEATGNTGAVFQAATPYTFIYNATLGAWLIETYGIGADDSEQSYAPVPILCQICNLVGADCWFNIPATYDDVSIQQVATEIVANLDSTHSAYLEYSNEVFGPNFNTQSQMTKILGTAKGFPSSYSNYYGYQSAHIKSLAAAIGGSQIKVIGTGLVIDYNFPSSLETTRFGGTADFAGSVPLKVDVDGNYTRNTSGSTATATFNGYLTKSSGYSVLTVTSVGSGTVAAGLLSGPSNLVGNSRILGGSEINFGVGDCCTGSGSTGTYLVNWLENVGSSASTASFTLTTKTAATDYSTYPNRPGDIIDAIGTTNYIEGAVLNGYGSYDALENASYNITNVTTSSGNPSVITLSGMCAASAPFSPYSNGDRIQFTSGANAGFALNPNYSYGYISASATIASVSCPANQITLSNILYTLHAGADHAVSFSGNTVTLDNQFCQSCLYEHAPIQFFPGPVITVSGNGYLPGTLPANITAGTTYYVSNLSGGTFNLCNSAGSSCTLTLGSWTQQGSTTAVLAYSSDFLANPGSAWTSGGAVTRYIVGNNTGMLAALDQYNLGNKSTAMDWMYNDTVSGTTHDSNYNTVYSTMETNISTYWPWYATAATHFGKSVMNYEGAWDPVMMTATQNAKLGISASYANLLIELFSDFKNDAHMYNLYSYIFSKTKTVEGNGTGMPAQSADIGTNAPQNDGTQLWSMFPRGLYTSPYTAGATCPSNGTTQYCIALPWQNYNAIQDFH